VDEEYEAGSGAVGAATMVTVHGCNGKAVFHAWPCLGRMLVCKRIPQVDDFRFSIALTSRLREHKSSDLANTASAWKSIMEMCKSLEHSSVLRTPFPLALVAA